MRRRPPRALTLMALAAGALVMLPSAVGAPAAAPRPEDAVWGSSPLVVFGGPGRHGGIYTIRPAGGGLRRLTAAGGADGGLALSPNGRTVLFNGGSTLYRIQTDGSGLRSLGSGFEPAWSPNGREIAFVRGTGISIMNSDGTGVHLLRRIDNTDVSGDPTWAPNGRKIAYTACTAPVLSVPCEHQTGYDVYVIGTGGGGRHRVTHTSGFPQCPAWSSAGKLAFLTTQRTVGIVQASGALRTFSPGGCPVWAPGGRRYAVTTAKGATLRNADGSARRNVTVLPHSFSDFSSVDWSGDGRSLVLVGGDISRLHIYIVHADGSGLRKVL